MSVFRKPRTLQLPNTCSAAFVWIIWNGLIFVGLDLELSVWDLWRSVCLAAVAWGAAVPACPGGPSKVVPSLAIVVSFKVTGPWIWTEKPNLYFNLFKPVLLPKTSSCLLLPVIRDDQV